jgi:hypothetical protein
MNFASSDMLSGVPRRVERQLELDVLDAFVPRLLSSSS